MKNLIGALIVGTLLFFGCGSSQQKDAVSAGVNITPEQLAVKYDPVCKMSLENTAINDTTFHHGGIYGFCNAGCKKAFLEHPHKHISH